MKILYFARFRQIIGKSSEDIVVPEGITTVRGLMNYLMANDNGCAAAFAEEKTVRAAIDQNHATLDAPIDGAKEIAFFPPVTGG
jgi:sulfur-carrier protein